MASFFLSWVLARALDLVSFFVSESFFFNIVNEMSELFAIGVYFRFVITACWTT